LPRKTFIENADSLSIHQTTNIREAVSTMEGSLQEVIQMFKQTMQIIHPYQEVISKLNQFEDNNQEVMSKLNQFEGNHQEVIQMFKQTTQIIASCQEVISKLNQFEGSHQEVMSKLNQLEGEISKK
jgi:predicted nuclease with TOPRIM domain